MLKRYGKGAKQGLIQYSAGLDTFSQYLSLPSWDEQAITNRADFLCEKAIAIWTDK